MSLKGLIIFHNHMEDGEALFTKALLKRSGIEMTSISITDNKLIKTGYNQLVYADKLSSEISLNDYDFLVIPGGRYVFEIYDDNKLDDIINHFYKNDQIIAAICAAPMFLGKLGILTNKMYTAFPGVENKEYKGIYLKEEKAVIDKNIITGRSAGSVIEFVFLIVETLLGLVKKKELADSIKY